MASDPIKIVGLREFNKALKGLDSNLPKAVRLSLNEAVDLVIDTALPWIPRRSGRAAKSVKAKSTRTTARASAGGNRAPYYPWLDFGGRVGLSNTIERPFYREGRYLYVAYGQKRAEVGDILERSLRRVAEDAGLDVT